MVIVHIGTDKTGSTAIQKLINSNRDVLEAKDWVYPTKTWNLEHNHTKISIALGQNEFEILQKLREEIEASGRNNVLLSFEGFYTLNEEQISAFVSALQSLNRGEVKIIIYLRRQDDKIESGILQNIKSGDSRVLDLERYYSQIEPATDYRSIVEKWRKFIKKENIIIRPYGKEFLPHKHSLYDDFFHYALNLDFSEVKESMLLPKKDPNPSLDAVSGYIADFFAKMIKDDFNDALISQLLAIQNRYGVSKTYLFDKEERDRILSLYKEGNDALVKAYQVTEALFAPGEKAYHKPAESEIVERLSYLYQRQAFLQPLSHWSGYGGLKGCVDTRQIALVNGFYDVQEQGVWTNGFEVAELSFLIWRDFYNSDNSFDVIVKSSYLPGSDTVSFMKIGDGEWMALTGVDRYRISSEEVRRNGGVVVVEFKHDQAASPKELNNGDSNDNRVLGCWIKAVNFQVIDAVQS